MVEKPRESNLVLIIAGGPSAKRGPQDDRLKDHRYKPENKKGSHFWLPLQVISASLERDLRRQLQHAAHIALAADVGCRGQTESINTGCSDGLRYQTR